MAPDRRRLIVLVAILVLVSGIAVWRFSNETGAGTGAAGGSGAVPARRGAPASGVTAPDVRLRALNEERPQPDTAAGRDLFRFRTKAAPPAPPAPPPSSSPATATPAARSSSGLAPITLRFIGLVEPAASRRIAILSDSRGIYQGREGDIIEGRYRILRIGVESIEMAYVDGSGRQTIRLSGS
jgi:hypothetical protein